MGVESKRMLEAVASRLFGADAGGDVVALGRYAILERLGQGGMGAVYRAYDPELRREVALKVVEDAGPEGEARATRRERTLREAQMLARLSHPNVVAVHDVGVTEAGVYLAMELVVGSDLARWLEQHPPGTRRRTAQALALVQQAVEGLAAAHAANVIHRDIKPANILIGHDGRVRVADFGLARQDHDVPSQDDTLTSTEIGASVTRTGAVVGTPAYMPPEQLRGEAVDRRSDTFSMCATAWELLCGVRPYDAKTIEGLLAALDRGRPRPMPPRARVPRAIERVLLQGLCPDPNARWATMDALATALRRTQRSQWTWAGAGAVVAAALAFGLRGSGDDAPHERCAGQSGRLAALVQREGGDPLRAHFEATLPIGTEIHTRTLEHVDAHAQEWADAFAQACRSRWLDATASPERFDATMRCLERDLANTEHFIQTLATAPSEVVARAPAAALSLGSARACAEPEPSGVAPPTDPEALQQWEAHRTAIEQVQTSIVLEDYRGAEALARSTLAAVQDAGFGALEARLVHALGVLEDRTGSPEEAVELTDEALWKAVAAGDDTTVAKAALQLSYVVGVELGDFEEGLRWTDRAKAAIERVGDPQELDVERRFHRASILDISGASAEAEAILAALLVEEADAEGVGRVRLASICRDLGMIRGARGEFEEADRLLRRALELQTAVAGRWTQDASHVLIEIGMNLMRQTKYAEAQALFEEALEIRRTVVGPDSLAASEALQSLSIVAHMRGHFEDAERFGREAYGISVAIVGAQNIRSVAYGLDVVNALSGQGEPAQALAFLEPLVVAGETAFGTDSPRFASTLAIRARVHRDLGRFDDAVADAERAIAIRRAVFGASHPDVANAVALLDEIERARWGEVAEE
jgi:tetratricopeptide (TPR) repeat protein